MTHYLIFDTETDFPAPYHGADVVGGTEGMYEANVGAYASAQVDFIKRDLAHVDRSQTPWVVALGHRPWYTADAPADQFTDGLAVFETLFTEGNVRRRPQPQARDFVHRRLADIVQVDVVMHGHV